MKRFLSHLELVPNLFRSYGGGGTIVETLLYYRDQGESFASLTKLGEWGRKWFPPI